MNIKNTKFYLSSFFSLLVLIAVPAPAFCWNDFGHMAVAGIAYRNLKPQVRSRADQLVRLNPSYSTWLAALKPESAQGDKNMMLFMLAATWPDAIKGDSSYKCDGLDNGYRPDGITSSLNSGYDDKLLHKYWHFVDVPFSPDKTKLLPVPSPNGETEIAVCRATLASASGDQLKSYDLNWLLHLVGDLHQPLHCVNRITKGLPDGDSGGNAVKIYDTEPPTLLHSYWDEMLGSERNPAAVTTFIDSLPKAATGKSKNLRVSKWINESFAYCKKNVYVDPVGVSERVEALTPTYKSKALRLAKLRVALAGARLANILNAELK
ncbi:S1/P1 nuclease [soil metagenome]